MRLAIWTLALSTASLVTAAPDSIFKGSRAKKFQVTQHLPGIPLTFPTSWAGTLPISAEKDAPELFFWYFPPRHPVGEDNLSIWLNGGPGCSSMIGLFEENGPVLMHHNTTKIVHNPWSWTNLTGMLYIDQPAGVGFGKGSKQYRGERDIAKDFYYFLGQFMEVFEELKGKKLYITGESYAGQYIPYIADEIFSRPAQENKKNGLDLRGISIGDPCFDNWFFQEDSVAVTYALEHPKAFRLNSTFVEKLKSDAAKNGMTDFPKKHLHFPPKGPINIPKEFDLENYYSWFDIADAATLANPYFNPYNINPHDDKTPLVDPLGNVPYSQVSSTDNFFNDPKRGGKAFKEAIHAGNTSYQWIECVDGVFAGKYQIDHSPAPADNGVLAKVIARSDRTLILQGELDFVIITEGSLLGIQNMTWGHKQGFQKRPSSSYYVGGKDAGVIHTERGLTYATVKHSGHMVPEDQPEVAYRLMQYFLGQVDEKDLTRSGAESHRRARGTFPHT